MNYEIRITGRVQGVGYRYFVLKIAHTLNIKGFVKNMPDGSVFISAYGSVNDLDRLTDHLKIGPARARVDKIIIEKFHTMTKLDDFITK